MKSHIQRNSSTMSGNSIPKSVVLHFTNIKPNEAWDFEGYKVTSPEKTIHDILQNSEISDEIVVGAILDGIDKGLISKYSITKHLKSNKRQRILKQINL